MDSGKGSRTSTDSPVVGVQAELKAKLTEYLVYTQVSAKAERIMVKA